MTSAGNDALRRWQERDVPGRQRPSRCASDRLSRRAHLPRARRDRRGGAGERLAQDRRCDRDAGTGWAPTRAGELVPIAFRARVLGGAAWTLTVLDAHGAPVASNSGSGGTIVWSWPGTRSDGTPLVPGTKLAYRIEAQDAAGVAAPPAARVARRAARARRRRRRSRSRPAVISPDGDGVDDRLAIGYTLAGPSTVSLDVLAPDGSTVDGARAGRAGARRRAERALGRGGPAGARGRRHLHACG